MKPVVPAHVDDHGIEWFDTIDEHGYFARKTLPDGRIAALATMLYTTRLLWFHPGDQPREFWCYPHLVEAVAAFYVWDGEGDPADGWVKHHPSHRRRIDGDPATERIEP